MQRRVGRYVGQINGTSPKGVPELRERPNVSSLICCKSYDEWMAHTNRLKSIVYPKQIWMSRDGHD